MKIDIRRATGSYDTDTEDRLIKPDNYRYGLNGRSGTSDQDGVGAVEGIRGNSLVETGITGDIVIGSCADVKNNAIIRFVFNAARTVTFTSASISGLSPLQGVIVGPSATIYVGTVLSVTQSSGTFTAIVTLIFGNIYSLTFIAGSTPTVAAITGITIPNYNYIKRYYASTAVTEFITNPALIGPVLGWSSTTRIYNPRVVEAGFTQLLVWTDPTPRIIDVDKMRQ